MFIKIAKDIDRSVNLLTYLIDNNYNIDACCNGNLVCGKCKVKVVKGEFEYIPKELKILSEKERAENIILACHHNISNIEELEILEIKNIISQDEFESIEIKKSKYEIKNAKDIENLLEEGVTLKKAINLKLENEYNFKLEALQKISNLENLNSFYLLIKDEKEVIDASQEDNIKAYGYSIDIGGTTVVISIVDILNKKVLKKNSVLNPQKNFGSDVISRIGEYYNRKDNHLSDILIGTIKNEILSQIDELKIEKNLVKEIVVTGNTAMLSFFTRVNPYRLSQSPFTAIDMDKKELTYDEVFLTNELKARVTILPSIASYVGADITAGLYHIDILDNEKNIIFIDIGTNGELALKDKKGNIYVTATAAGPAFEGANIRNGVGSIPGAINNVNILSKDEIYINTILDEEPVGICGSGIISSISELLKNNIVDETGRMENEYFPLLKAKDIKIYQEDIRAFQLAKSAIAAGIETLLLKAELTCKEIDEIVLAGGFGSNLNIENSINIGLLPTNFAKKIKIAGNTSLGGGIKYLLDLDGDLKINKILENSKFIDLATDVAFTNSYINNIFLRSVSYD